MPCGPDTSTMGHRGTVPGATAVPLRSLRPPTPLHSRPCGASSAPCSGTQTRVLGEQAGTPGRAVPGSRVTPCPGVPVITVPWVLGSWGSPEGLEEPPMEPGGAGEPPGSSAPSLAAWPLTGAVPFSLLSAGHADDLQRGQGAGAALQAEGEDRGGPQILSVPGRAAPSPLQGPSGPALRAGFVPGRTTWCGRKPRA